MKLEDRIGIVIVRHLGSRNLSYPDDSFTAKKFVALANELAKTLRQLPAAELKKLTADEFWSITPQLVSVTRKAEWHCTAKSVSILRGSNNETPIS